MTNKDNLKKIIDMSVDVIKDVPPELQDTALKLVLQKLLDSYNVSSSEQKSSSSSSGISVSTPKGKLATLCDVSEEELDNVILEKDQNLEIVCGITGIESFKMIVGALIILGSREILFGKEWASSSEILSQLKKIGIEDKGGNFAAIIKSKSDLFLKRPSAKEYRLTTGDGRKVSYSIIRKLSKNMSISKNDLVLETTNSK